MLSTRKPVQTSRLIQTESEKMEKYIPCKQEEKESWSNSRNFNTPLTPMDRSSKQKINKQTQVLNDTLMRWISLMSLGHPIQMQKNTPSSQVHMEHSPGQTTSCFTNQASVNLRKLKLYQASSLITMQTRYKLQENKCKKHKHKEIKQHISKQPTGY